MWGCPLWTRSSNPTKMTSDFKRHSYSPLHVVHIPLSFWIHMGYPQEAYFAGFGCSVMVFDNCRKESWCFRFGNRWRSGLIVDSRYSAKLFFVGTAVCFRAEAGRMFAFFVFSMS